MDKSTLRRDVARRRRCRAALCLLLGYTLSVEWAVYLAGPWWQWPAAGREEAATRLLLVADPQLLGRLHTARGPLGALERWDADRFISKTFALANDYLKPHVVIFLGDLFDEGELATDEDFRSYVERFFAIFAQLNYQQAIFVPGDNDIGGEGHPVGSAELRRFSSYFRNDTFLTYRGIDFIKVSYLRASYAYRSYLSKLGSNVRIVLSHVPLSTSYGRYMRDSVHLVAEQGGPVERLDLQLGVDGQPLRLHLPGGRLHELRLPPCSYRLGTPAVGFGAALLGPEERVLTYGVLWSPRRLLHLAGYLAVLPVCAALCLPSAWQLACALGRQLARSPRAYSTHVPPC